LRSPSTNKKSIVSSGILHHEHENVRPANYATS